MKQKRNIRKIVLGTFALAAVGLIGTMGVVSAYQGDPTEQGPNFDMALHAEKLVAFEERDYNVWKDLMEQEGANGRVLQVVNAENFNTFVEAHNAALAGDMEKSNELRAELGLNNGQGPKDGTYYGQGRNSGRSLRG
jgi:hypothetical protein